MEIELRAADGETTRWDDAQADEALQNQTA
jgi:hypothetical protein